MAWYFTEFYKAIYDRLAGDATLTGLTGIYSLRAPDTVTTYVATGIELAGTDNEAFRTLARDLTFRVLIVVPADGADPLSAISVIAERIEGNWYAKAFGVAPDYGLSRWTPTLSGGWNCTTLGPPVIETVDAGENRLALGMAFEATITRNAV